MDQVVFDDQAYCAYFLNDGRGLDFTVGDPGAVALGAARSLAAFAARAGRPEHFAGADARLTALAQTRVHMLHEFMGEARESVDGRVAFREYLRSHWIAERHRVRTRQPLYFVITRDGTPRAAPDFDAFLRAELAKPALKAQLAALGSLEVAARTLVEWMPRAPVDRLAALRRLDGLVAASWLEPHLASDLAEAIVGFRYRADVAREGAWDANALSMAGAPRLGLYTEYAHFARLWTILRPRDDDTFVDLGAGHGRAAVSLRAHGHQTKYVGYELVPERVSKAREIFAGLALDPARARVERADLAHAPIADADYYFLFNPFPPSVLARVWSELGRKAAAGRRFRVITANVSLFADIEATGDYPQLARFYGPKPGWLGGPARHEVADNAGGRRLLYVYATNP